MTKKLSIGLNVVLLLAVGHLYYLTLRSGTEAADEKAEGAEEKGGGFTHKVPEGSLKIGFVKGDSILNNYQFLEAKYEELNNEQVRLEQELRQKVERYKKKAKKFQEEQTYMTQQEMQKKRKELMSFQQQIQKDRQRLTGDLRKMEKKMQKRLFENLNDYLKDYNKNKKFDYILNYQPGGQVLFCNDSLNITQEVLNGLNAAYDPEQDTGYASP